jgi:hypothetical protein
MDSEGITPPNSPGAVDVREGSQTSASDNHEQETFYFNCRGVVLDRFAGASHVRHMLHDQFHDMVSSGLPKDLPATVRLFEFYFPTAFVCDRINELFLMARQHFQMLLRWEPRVNAETVAIDIRRNLRQFFDFLRKYLSKMHQSNESRNNVLSIIRHIQQFLLFVGPLPDPTVNTSSGLMDCQINSTSYHVFHAHIELRWAFIDLLHLVTVFFPECNGCVQKLLCYQCPWDGCNSDVVSEVIQLLIWELVSLASKQHNSMSLVDYKTLSVFPCYCMQELFICIVQLAEFRKQKLASQSFWILAIPVLHHLLKSNDDRNDVECETSCSVINLPPSDLSCLDPVGFCWWFLDHVSDLYFFDQTGSRNSSLEHVPDCYFFMQSLVQSSTTALESRLRCYLQCALRIQARWHSSATVIVLLWDHFYKNLNNQFSTNDSSLSAFVSVGESAVQLLEKCQSIAVESLASTQHDNSFHLFLRILSFYLKRSSVPAMGNEWRQIKGRLFSKFYSRKMQELNESGLCNVTWLFIVLAHVTDLQDTAAKLCELYAMIDIENSECRRRQIVVRGLLALVVLCVQKQINASFLIESVADHFNIVCKEFCSPSITDDAYESLWKVIQIYLEAVQDIIDSSNNLGLQQHKLISSGFHHLLTGCKDSELHFVLSILQAVFMQLRFILKRGHPCGSSVREFADALWTNVFVFIRSHSTAESAPIQLADAAACFTLLAMDLPPSTASAEDFSSCLTYFSSSEQVVPHVIARFLYLILSHQYLMKRLPATLPSYEKLFIQSWLRCAWRMDPSTDILLDLSRLIFGLPAAISIFDRAKLDMPNSYNGACRLFIKAVGKGFDLSAQDLRTRSEYRTVVMEYFGDVRKHVNWLLCSGKSVSLTTNVYCLAGFLVKHCGQLIYIKSSPSCLLPFLLDKLFSPRLLSSSNRDIPSPVLSAIRLSLHLFVLGLARLDYGQDAYIQRKLRDFVIAFLTRFQQELVSNESSAVHPLIKALSSSLLPSVSSEASSFRQHVLEVICTGVLSVDRPAADEAEISKVLCFLLNLLNKTRDISEKVRNCQSLLIPCLSLMLQSDSQAVKDLATQVVTQLMDATRKLSACDSIVDNVKALLRKFILLKKQTNLVKLLKVLEPVALIYHALFSPLIPLMTQIVQESEVSRGVGIDKQIRLHYFNFLSSLGEDGQTEKLKLIKETAASSIKSAL